MRLLIIGLFFISCSTNYETEKHMVEGDWIFIETPEEITTNYFGLRFESDTLYKIHEDGFYQEGKFVISGDTIIVSGFGGKINKERRIKKQTKDSLILTGGLIDNKYYSRKLEYTENLKLNNLKIITGNCYGDCPEFNLRLTESGMIYFKPIINCKVTEEKEFILDGAKKSKIDSLFKWTYIHKLDTSKLHGAVDDWPFNIEITYNNGQIIEFKTTQFYIPFRMKGIFSLLINDLKKRELI